MVNSSNDYTDSDKSKASANKHEMTKIFLKALKIKIGGLIVKILSDDYVLRIGDDEFQRKFIIADGAPDIVFRIHLMQMPIYDSVNKILEFKDENGARSLMYIKDNFVLQSNLSEYPFQYYVVMNINQNSCHFYFQNDKLIKEYGLNLLTRQFRIVYVLMLNSLQNFNGLFLHACAINNNGHGHIFTGKSGSGKSTLAKLWKNKENCYVSSDEMIIVRRIEKRFKVYGTPWVSDVKECSPQDVPLKNIFFIKHAKTNIITHLFNINAIISLLNSSWLNPWSLHSMQNTFNLLDQLAKEIPFYELSFVPDENVLNLIMCTK